MRFNHAMDVTIADITLRLRSERPLSLRPDDLPYQGFTGATDNSADILELKVLVQPPSVPSDAKRLFDGGGAWELFTTNGRYLYRSGAQAPDGVALLGADFRPGTSGSASVDLIVHPSYGNNAPLDYPARYPMDQVLLLYALLERGGLLIHAAGMELHSKAYLFPGISGAGKSTICRLLAAQGYKDALLSDDRIALRASGESLTAWGTPWPGDAEVVRNVGAPLSALLFLQQGGTNAIKRIPPKEATRRLLPAVSVPWFDTKMANKALEILDSVVVHTPAYVYTFTPDNEAIETFEEFVSG